MRRSICALVLLFAACVDKSDDPHLGASSGSGGPTDDGGTEDVSESTDAEADDDDAAAPYCGDARCDPDEDCASCPDDCNTCPSGCGDGTCDPGEHCGSCANDCGECCGNGVCDVADGEDWQACWGDCEGEAPLEPLSAAYAGCAGATELAGVPAGDRLWVRSDTGTLVYVADDVPVELPNTVLVGAELRQNGETIGVLECGSDDDGGCLPVIVVSVYPDTGGESVPCLFAHYETLGLELAGTSLATTTGEYFAPCSTLCGNGVCDENEVQCSVTNTSHECSQECGTGEPCPACA